MSKRSRFINCLIVSVLFLQLFLPVVSAEESTDPNALRSDEQNVVTADEGLQHAAENEKLAENEEQDPIEGDNENLNTTNDEGQVESQVDEVQIENNVHQVSESDVKEEENQEVIVHQGMTIANPTNVYAEPTTSSNIVKSYKPGIILELEEYNTEFLKVNLDHLSGFVKKSDIELDVQQENLQGFAGKHPVNVYDSPDRNSKVLKSYSYGRILKYRTFTAEWYVATVYINGNPETGYIHKDDVGETVTNHRGVSLKNKTHVYSNPNESSSVIKSYPKGRILKYKAYNSKWYIATVYINGKKSTGYIKHSDVDNVVSEQETLRGIGIRIPTNVYASPNTGSKVLKTYRQGHSLKYRTFSKDWYEATVYIDGEKKTGYIYKADTGNNNTALYGYSINHFTPVFSNASPSSAIVKTYQKGTLLKYQAHNSDWFKATVYVKGKKTTGYIRKQDVGNAPILQGVAQKRVNVYSRTSTGSSVLKSYKKGSILKYRPLDRNWFIATVYINGKPRTGYIYKKDVKLIVPTGNTNIVNPMQVYSYNKMVRDIQELYKAYPDLISYKVIGKSEYGRNIYAVSIGNGKPTAFINGSHHAREWLTTNLNMYMIEQYAKAYYKNQKIDGYDVRKILNGTTLWFVPMVNPDGVTLQQQGLKAFPKSLHSQLIKMNGGSKNFKRWKANAKGVDLNRQYDAGWKTIRYNTGKPYYKNFKGYKAASAAETKAILKFVREINPEMSVSYHSTGKIIFWNYLQTGSRYARDHAYARQLAKMTGYSLVYPVGIPSGGGFTDWFISSQKKPAFTIEISRYYYETNPPLSEFPGAWRENKAVGLFIAQESAKLYKK